MSLKTQCNVPNAFGNETSVKNHYFDADTLNARIKYYILWFKIISKNLKLTTTPTEQKYLVL